MRNTVSKKSRFRIIVIFLSILFFLSESFFLFPLAFRFSFPEDFYARRNLLPFLPPNGCPRCIKVSAEHRSVLIWKHRETNMCSVCDGRCVWCGCHAVKRSIIQFSCCINKPNMSCIRRNV